MATPSRNVAASVAQVVASALIMFALYRTLLETLGAKRLGIWSVVLATASASRIGDLGLSASVTRFVAKYRARQDDRAAGCVVQTAALSIAGLLGLALLFAYPGLDLLFERLFVDQALIEARALLPYALVSLGLTAVASVFQSGLEGCQRYDRRVLLVVAGQLLFLSAALWLAPRHGLVGLAWAQIGQGVVLVVLGWFSLRRLLPGLPWLPWRWRRVFFREMLGYGLQFQVSSVAMMLFDPLTKALLGKYGGLSVAGYYEMAGQFVSKARALIVSANQVLVPLAADLHERDPGKLGEVYRTNLRLLFFVVLPLYALVVAWAPPLSELWIGRYEPKFVFFVGVLTLAWGLNTFAGPAYFSNLGTGRISWNTLTQVWMGLANAGLGLALGPHYGAEGIVWGMAIALISGSGLVVVAFHREHRLSWRLLLPAEAIGCILGSAVAIAASDTVYQIMASESTMERFLLILMTPLLVLAPILWCHPLRSVLLGRVHGRFEKRIAVE
ncbi:MAG TPA: lipopolysaccharide biosynthesis protein [Methylococcus sp.]|nr:lipopolysaccharide biosynthesis protein [Methylococcus sp.]